MLRTGETHPVRIILLGVGSDAQKQVLGIGVAFFDVVYVIGTNQGYAGLITEFFQHGVCSLLFGQAVILHLQVVALVIEDRGEPEGALFCLLILVT